MIEYFSEPNGDIYSYTDNKARSLKHEDDTAHNYYEYYVEVVKTDSKGHTLRRDGITFTEGSYIPFFHSDENKTVEIKDYGKRLVGIHKSKSKGTVCFTFLYDEQLNTSVEIEAKKYVDAFLKKFPRPSDWKGWVLTFRRDRKEIGDKETPELEAPQSNDPFKTQIGGDHYKNLKIQPTEYALANDLPFCEGNVVKYITRYKFKDGLKDLKKAKHYIEMLIKDKYGEEEG
jgi:hypothetical protein